MDTEINTHTTTPAHSSGAAAVQRLRTHEKTPDFCAHVINAILRKHHFSRRIERIRGRGFQWVEE